MKCLKENDYIAYDLSLPMCATGEDIEVTGTARTSAEWWMIPFRISNVVLLMSNLVAMMK